MSQLQKRREFIRNTTTGIIGLGMVSAPLSGGADTKKAKVAVVRNERAISDRNECNSNEAAAMLDKALFTVTGKKKPRDAWTSLGVTKDDVVGIKVNCNSWTFLLSTHPELVYVLCDSLSTVVRPNNIIIYERKTSELTRSGYRANKSDSGVRCFGTDEGGGFHPGEDLTRIITDTCTKIINMPSLKTVESEFGGSLFLKNHIGSLPHGKMPLCHGYAEFCTDVCSHPSIKNKTVLAVCDGLRGTYKRGVPWYWKGIIMSRDQVAAEYAALNVINEKRKQEKENVLMVPEYVKLAETKYSLGISSPANIDIAAIKM